MAGEDVRSNVFFGGHAAGKQVCPQTVVVQQIVGKNEQQQTVDVHIRVPRQKPAIEQIIDVFVKKVIITDVKVLTNKVIVCGHFEVKAIYVACIPSQAVHAVDARCVRFTADVPICGARCGMDADACVTVEFIDYECDKRTRPYWYKCECDDDCGEYKHHKKGGCQQHCHHHKCARKFDVFVTLKICAKVMTDRQIIVYPGVSITPKG